MQLTVLLYLITWLTDFAAFLLIFTVSRHLAEQNADPITLGLVGAFFAGACTISNTFGGRMADRFGRKPVTLFGSILLLLSILGMIAVDPQSPLLFVAYSLGGFALGFVYPALIAWLSQGRRGRAVSSVAVRFCIAFNFGMVCGQVSGGSLLYVGGYLAPLYLALSLVVVSLGTILLTPEVLPLSLEGNGNEPLQSQYDMQRATAFSRICWIANFGGTFSASIVFYLLPILLVNLRVDPQVHGFMLAANRGMVICTLIGLHLSTFWHFRFAVAVVAQSLGVLGLVGLATLSHPATLTLALCFLSVMLGMNYFSSLYYTTTGSADHQKGSRTGINEATLAFGLTGGSLFGGLVGHAWGSRAPFVFAAGLVIVLIVLQIYAYRRVVAPSFGSMSLEAAMDD